jgi:hypothetical protein
LQASTRHAQRHLAPSHFYLETGAVTKRHAAYPLPSRKYQTLESNHQECSCSAISQPNVDLKKYREAKEEWKDSTPLYRHINPRPETWIPHKILETNYNIPTAEEKQKKRLEYLDIVEEIKDQIPPEYYEHWHDFYSRPVNFDNEGPDKTGRIGGYKPTMFSHPMFGEKDHSKYHALPREKMFPEDEMLYNLQETHQVKESLDVLEDDGLDYEERMWKAKRRAQQKQLEDEKTMREEAMRGTQWIDWDNEKEETIDLKGDVKRNEPPWSPETPNRLAKGNPVSDITPVQNIKLAAQSSEPLNAGTPKVSEQTNSGLAVKVAGLAVGVSMCSAVYRIWKLLSGALRQRKPSPGAARHAKRTEHMSGPSWSGSKHSARAWNHAGSHRRESTFEINN